jgi:hypothetical protein
MWLTISVSASTTTVTVTEPSGPISNPVTWEPGWDSSAPWSAAVWARV